MPEEHGQLHEAPTPPEIKVLEFSSELAEAESELLNGNPERKSEAGLTLEKESQAANPGNETLKAMER